GRRAGIAIASIWGLAAWGLASMLWADSPGSAWEGTNRVVLYAALPTLVLVTLLDRTAVRTIAVWLLIGVAGISLFTLVDLHVEGKQLFLAGRLNAPEGYRNATAGLFAVCFWPLLCR